MPIATDHLRRCIRTLDEAVRLYEAATEDSIEQEVFRNAVVKGFELTQETALKLLRRAAREAGEPAGRINAMPAKELLRLAAERRLISVEAVSRWFAYRDNRNDTAHDYGIGFAHETLSLLPGFLADARALEAELHARFAGGG